MKAAALTRRLSRPAGQWLAVAGLACLAGSSLALVQRPPAPRISGYTVLHTFSPSPEEIAHARRVVAAFEEAERAGKGVTSLDGKVVDVPVVKRARALLEIAESMPHRQQAS